MTGGLAVVTAVRDRAAALQASLARWVADPAIDEVVVVDWGSELPLHRAGLPGAGKVTLLAAGQGEPWAPGLALNLGMEAARSALALCLPPGAVLADAGGLAAIVAGRGGFFSPCGLGARLVLVARDDVRRVGGFHEWLLGDGFSFPDLFNRLEDAGVVRRFLADDAVANVGPPAATGAPLPSPDATGVALPDGLDRDAFFAGERNKLLAGMAPWQPALAALRPRRIGWRGEREATAQLAPRPSMERRLQDVATYLTARFTARVSEDLSIPLFAGLIDDRSAGDPVRAHRQHQIEAALAALPGAGLAPPRRR